jgi:hypothetical protein
MKLFCAGLLAYYALSVPVWGQTTLSLSSVTTTPGGTAVLELSLASSANTQPAALQWTLGYDANSINNIAVTAGAALVAAGKSVTCSNSQAGYTCLATGLNTNTIGKGPVAEILLSLFPAATSTSISLSNDLGASIAGDALPIPTTGATVTVNSLGQGPTISFLQCAVTTLAPNAATACLMLLSQAAPSGGITVALSDSNPALLIPTSITVPANSLSASFIASAASIITSNQTAVIRAALNGTSQNITMSLISPITATLSSLQCAGAALSTNANTTCTVGLSSPAPASGTAVGLSSNTSAITVPSLVTIPAGSSSASFTASVGAITSNQMATLTASFNGVSQTTALSLVQGPGISAFQCAITTLSPNGSTACLLILSQPAPSGGITVPLSNSNPALMIPAFLTIPAYSLTASFIVNAGSFSGNQDATITASLNGATQSINLTLASSSSNEMVSSLTCDAASLSANSSTTCSVRLSKPAPSGGHTVGLSSGSKALHVPAVVTVSANSDSAVFTASAETIPSGETASIGASLNGSSKNAELSLDPAVRVHAGGEGYTDSLGQAWSADHGFSGGQTCSTRSFISDTSDPSLYQTCRYGNFGYDFPMRDGIYTVKLRFAELAYNGPHQRAFNVTVNGAPALTGFDIFSQAGGALAATDRSIPVAVTGGHIKLQFAKSGAGDPMVNGIEIVPGIEQPLPTIRLRSGGQAETDALGRVWAADNSFSGGLIWNIAGAIANTADPSLYQTSRYGDFSYTLHAPDGRYNIRLKFAEPLQSSAGQRLFNVVMNGAPVLTNFDIFAEAGGAQTALEKSFPVSVTGGQVVIQFTGNSTDWSKSPMVNAIELVPVSGSVRRIVASQ